MQGVEGEGAKSTVGGSGGSSAEKPMPELLFGRDMLTLVKISFRLAGTDCIVELVCHVVVDEEVVLLLVVAKRKRCSL
jgi:hypothetical protein